MVPDCVLWVMNELRILSLDIQTMLKDPTTRFGKLSHNPYRSVRTFATRDTPTLRQWWDEDNDADAGLIQPDRCTVGRSALHPLPA